MTPDEFRADAAGWGGVENIEVGRSLREIAATFRDRAPACLQDVETTTINGPAQRRMMTKWRYHETVLVSDRKVELIVQGLLESSLKMYEEPANGTYVLIARAFPIDGRRTRVEISGSAFGRTSLHAAVRAWAAGTSVACPDMTS
jgi:hypothetical protein